MSISFKEATDNELVQPKILQTLPKECECGAQLIFDDQLQRIMCQDVQCETELIDRFYRAVRKSGQASWTREDCAILIREKRLKTPYQLFRLPRMLKQGQFKTSVQNLGDKLIEICDPQHTLLMQQVFEDIQILQSSKLRVLELYQIVEISQHKYIAQAAKDLFRGTNSIQEAYTYIKLWPITFIQNRLGLVTEDGQRIASEIYSKLLEIENELRFGEKYFTIKTPQVVTLNIATCGQLADYTTVTEFIDNVEHRYNGKVAINLVPSIYSQLDAYINDFDIVSAKFRRASDLNEQYQLKKLARHEISEDDIGKLDRNTQFHSIGEQIFIGSADKFIERLDRIYR